MITLCPANCGKKFISAEHAKAHADTHHPGWTIPKRKGWATPYGFVDFKEPVSYEEALTVAKAVAHKAKEGLK